jgi:hypothetical protein
MRTILLMIGISAGLLKGQNLVERPVTPYRNLWLTSATALAAANALDIHSSWGKHELNSALAGPSGSFGKQGALLKLGFQGGLIGIEYLITHRRPSARLYRALSFVNFGAAAAFGATAAHNYTVPQ